MNTRRTVGLAMTLIGGGFIAVMTLVPHPKEVANAASTSLWCLLCGALGSEDFFLNVLLFLPLGLGLGVWGLSFRRSIVIIAASTLLIESLQLGVVTGRDASLGDLLANTTGGALGFLLCHHWRAVVLPTSRSAWRLLATGAALWAAVQTGTALLLSRSLPRTTYYGQWAPELGHLELFEGTVRSATINGDPVPGTRLDESARVRQALLRDTLAISVEAVTAGATPGLAPIFSMYDDHRTKIFLVGQEGRDVVFEIRQRASALRLRSPSLALPDALPLEPGADAVITAGLEGAQFYITAATNGETRTRMLGFSPSWGWYLVLPYDYAFGPAVRLLTALWVGGLLLPLAYWGWRTGGGRLEPRVATLLLPTVGFGLGFVPAAFRFPPVHWSEWVAAAAGLILGWGLARGASRLPNGQP